MVFTRFQGSPAGPARLTCKDTLDRHGAMTHSPATPHRLPLVFLLAALLVAFGASALSRRDQTGVDAILAQMATAEAR